MELVHTYGTPLKFTYTPVIGKRIAEARRHFSEAMQALDYRGSYTYAYCTKANHYRPVVETVLQHGCSLEVSSANDVQLVRALFRRGALPKATRVIANGYKPQAYLQALVNLRRSGFRQVLVVLDNAQELEFLRASGLSLDVGIRIAQTDANGNRTRFGVPEGEIPALAQAVAESPRLTLRMLHFFRQSGVKNRKSYWNALDQAVDLYTQLRPAFPTLTDLNLGGGLPFREQPDAPKNSGQLISRSVERIHRRCVKANVLEPNLVTEYGSYTVAEAGGTIFKVLDAKPGTDTAWWILDGSLMTTLPDTWALQQAFPVYALNALGGEQETVTLGGITCDTADTYGAAQQGKPLLLPRLEAGLDRYLGFFHTAAYQDALSGAGGLNHCLLPTPTHVMLSDKPGGGYEHEIVQRTEPAKHMLDLLGY